MSAHLSKGIMGGGSRVMYQGGQRAVSAHLSTGIIGGDAELCIKADRGQCQLTSLQV